MPTRLIHSTLACGGTLVEPWLPGTRAADPAAAAGRGAPIGAEVMVDSARRLVLFDIDGTILLTAGAGRRAIVAAIAEEVGDAAVMQEVRFDGKTDPQIVTELLEAAGHPGPHRSERVQALCSRYVDLLAARALQRPTSRTTVMPGVLPTARSSGAEEGVVLGLLTGNMAEGAALKLKAGGLDPARFRVGAYGSDCGHRPDLPAHRRAPG